MSKHAQGPYVWRKFGNEWALVTTHSGALIVMDFVRHGMQGAQPRFSDRSDNFGGIMINAAALGDLNQHPQARLFVAAPDLYEACRRALTCACLDSAVRAVIVNALAKADGEEPRHA